MSKHITTLSIAELDNSLGNVLCISNENKSLQEVCESLNIFSSYSYDVEYVVRVLLSEEKPDLILFELNGDTLDVFVQLRQLMMNHQTLSAIPFVLFAAYPSKRWLALAKAYQVDDFFLLPLADQYVRQRLKGLVEREEESASKDATIQWSLPVWKRIIDIIGSSILIMILSPLLLVVALLIKLESKGPIIYISKRVGQGFKVFPFLKFRSMAMDADQQIDALKAKNQYAAEQPSQKQDLFLKTKPQLNHSYTVLVQNDGYVFEEKNQEKASNSAFFKMKDDPRITRIGRFIRNTSIDELPQLFNVLRGDISLVGNRPLPLYEAEQLTSDGYVLRFAAPAGITGLWQVSKRGKPDMSEEERKQLDVQYALEYNFMMDLEILWKTLPAAVQQESV